MPNYYYDVPVIITKIQNCVTMAVALILFTFVAVVVAIALVVSCASFIMKKRTKNKMLKKVSFIHLFA